MQNMGFVMMVTAADFVAFGICYAGVYKLTARTYYKIVGGIGTIG